MLRAIKLITKSYYINLFLLKPSKDYKNNYTKRNIQYIFIKNKSFLIKI